MWWQSWRHRQMESVQHQTLGEIWEFPRNRHHATATIPQSQSESGQASYIKLSLLATLDGCHLLFCAYKCILLWLDLLKNRQTGKQVASLAIRPAVAKTNCILKDVLFLFVNLYALLNIIYNYNIYIVHILMYFIYIHIII